MLRSLAALTLACASLLPATLLTENFDNVPGLSGAGWVTANNSVPVGTTTWFQGNSGIFGSEAGAADSYVAANFNSAGTPGNISNWLITPLLSLADGATISFFTRGSNNGFADRLEVRLNTLGTTDVGASDTSVGDFTTLLVTVNAALSPSGYPADWTLVTATISGLGGPTNTRLAFRYFVPDTENNGDYIGIDSLTIADVPEPSTLALCGLAFSGLALRLRRRF